MCKDKQRGNYERGCFDIMSISLNRLLRFDAKVRVCIKKLRKKQYASWILLYFGHAARGRGKKNIIFEFLCFDLDLVLVPLRKQKMEKLKAVKKTPKWSEAEINALVNAVESQRRQILGSFSSDITINRSNNTWKSPEQVELELNFLSINTVRHVNKFFLFGKQAIHKSRERATNSRLCHVYIIFG